MTGFAAAVDPVGARDAARHILSGRQYRAAPTPRPLRKQLSWLGDRLHKPLDWIGNLLSHVPAPLLLLIALAAAAAAIAFVASKARARAGSPDERRRARRVGGEVAEDPVALERLAEVAEREGRLDDALRLRFRAGLLRLGDRGAIHYRPSVTTDEVRRVLGSDAFDELARTFDGVAYGGRDAEPPDVETARRVWPSVVAGARRPRSE